MINIYMLNEINNEIILIFSNKLENSPFNQYLPSWIKLENQFTYKKYDLNIALSLLILNTIS